MKHINFKKVLPHIIAVAVFLLVTVILCKPALDSDVVMQQGDITAVQSMRHQSDLVYQQTGNYPLWCVSMFSGMPMYQIAGAGSGWSPMGFINNLFQLWLPKPLNFFFLSCICFYFLCMCIRIRPYVAILGSLAFAFSTYTPIIIAAGHDTKVLSLAYAPALIGSIILLYDKKYIPGFILTALFAALHLANHPQINYYTFIIICFITLFYTIRWIKAKEFKTLAKVTSLAIAAALIGLMVDASAIFPVMDYTKYSKRGGQLVMDSTNNTTATSNNKTTGLSKDYAFQWSYGRAESFSLLFPGVMGYGSFTSERDGDYNIFPQLTESSNVSTYLTDKLNVPQDNADNITANLSGSIYWGDKPFTLGSNYLGAVICFLFILGMFFLDNKHKWWILSASIFGIILAMGKNLPGINYFLFDHLPFYNKFRTVEMALVIPQILFPIMAVLVVEKITEGNYVFVETMKQFKWSIIATAIVFCIAGIFYFSLDYSKENKERTAAVNAAFETQDATLNNRLEAINEKYEPETDNRLYEDFLYQSKGDTKIARDILHALRKDRQAFFGSDILRALLFIALAIGLIALFFYKKINAAILLIGLPLLTLIDLLPMDMHYINDKSFDDADKYNTVSFSESDADKAILQDKDPDYRIFDLTSSNPFEDSKPSYFHNSIGGYHPAKLSIYDDLITYQLSGRPNPAVLNMLNTKYLIERSTDGKTSVAVHNPNALGNCWFVKGVKYVSGPAAEMRALTDFNPADTAVIDTSYNTIVGNFSPADSLASIKESNFTNDDIKYQSSSKATNLAVFSEIFYKDWKAYIDGKPVPIAKANYVLRALPIPAGDHIIEFKFEPVIFNISSLVSELFSCLLTALLLAYGFYLYRNTKK
jgi:hypothetical protein